MLKPFMCLAAGLIMFWNIENMFLPGSGALKGWNSERFRSKCNMIAKTVLYLEDSLHQPGFIAFAEVENRLVLYRILSNTLLHDYPYDIVHYESDDRRGIDLALLYDSSSYTLLSKRYIPVLMDSIRLATRGIVYSSFASDVGDTVHIFVNHHPSKFSGESRTAALRSAAMSTLAEAVDSVKYACGTDADIIITGDFNEVPMTDTLPGVSGFSNLAYNLHKKGIGTIKFAGKWEIIDHFIVSDSMKGRARMQVFAPYFLKERDRKYLGWKPRRTFVGPRYNGGVSDHFPVIMVF